MGLNPRRLPLSCLPRQEKRSGQDRIRIVPGEGPDILMKSLQSDPSMLVRHLLHDGAFGEPGDMSCREGQECMHDKTTCGSNLQEPGFVSIDLLKMVNCTYRGIWVVQIVNVPASCRLNSDEIPAT